MREAEPGASLSPSENSRTSESAPTGLLPAGQRDARLLGAVGVKAVREDELDLVAVLGIEVIDPAEAQVGAVTGHDLEAGDTEVIERRQSGAAVDAGRGARIEVASHRAVGGDVDYRALAGAAGCRRRRELLIEDDDRGA